MSASIRQFTDVQNSIKTSVTGMSGSFSNTTLSGSALIVISTFSNDNGDISGITCTDPVGNNYTRILDVADTSEPGDQRFQMWYCGSALPLTSSQSITVNFTYTDYTELIIYEVTGLTSAPFIAAGGSWQTGISGGTANNLTTGNIAGGTSTCFFLGGTMNSLEGGTAPFYASVGTGLTQGGLFFYDTLDTGTTGTNAYIGTWGYGTFTSPGTTAYHFTAPSGASNTNFVTFGALFTVSNPSSLTITTTSPLTSGTVGASYSQTLAASGGTSPYTWTITSGTLPTGLALSSSGVISGTPSTAGTASIIIKVTDSASNTSSSTFSITVNSSGSSPTITTTSPLTSGLQGAAYSKTFTATGGTSPYTWSLNSGAFPAGLSFSSSGVLSGTPTASGTFSPVVKVTDAASNSSTSSFSLTIAPAVSITTSSLPTAITDITYSTTLMASGGTSPYTWSVSSGTLPSGFSLASNTGVISGYTTALSSSSITITVTDSTSATSSQAFTFTVQYAPSLGSASVWWLV